jgi:hypothetical protein
MGAMAIRVRRAGVARHEALAVDHARRGLIPVGVQVVPQGHAAIDDCNTDPCAVPTSGMGEVSIHGGDHMSEGTLDLPVR